MRKVLFVFLLIFSLFPLSYVFAHDGHVHAEVDGVNNSNNSSQKNNREDFREKRCEFVESRIDARVNTFSQNKQNHIDNYARLVTLFENALAKFQDAGLDTAALESSIATLKVLASDYAKLYGAFIAKLEEARAYPCGNSEGKFLALMQEAKELMRQVHSKRKEIREHFVTSLKPEVKALRQQLIDQAEDENPVLDERSTN